MTAEELKNKARISALNQAELAEVAAYLQSPSLPDDDRFGLLYALGRRGGPAYREVVERQLAHTRDPWVVRTALGFLCMHWGFYDDYLDFLEQAIDGFEWDIFNDAKQIAILLLGNYLETRRNPRLLARLIDIFENDPEEMGRDDAYEALVRALGRLDKELDRLSDGLASDMDPLVIVKAKQRLERESSMDPDNRGDVGG